LALALTLVLSPALATPGSNKSPKTSALRRLKPERWPPMLEDFRT